MNDTSGLTRATSLPYRLGLPAWAFPGWRNTYFTDHPSLLSSYASVFNSVEGNTTFYHIPDEQSVASWASAVRGLDFLFCFKLPRTVTHETRFSMDDLRRFLARLSPLHANMGPLLLQFPDWVGMPQLRRLKPVFDEVALRHDAVIEVRHPELFKSPELLEPLLEYYRFGRVILDSRPVHLGNIQHPDVLAAVHDKPDLPVLPAVYNNRVLLRLILHPDGVSNVAWINEWAERAARWLNEGIVPHVMIHCPNNQHCPLFAEHFHRALSLHMPPGFPELPAWPVPQQGSLL